MALLSISRILGYGSGGAESHGLEPSSKARAAEGREVRGHMEEGLFEARRVGPEKPSLTFGVVSDPISVPSSLRSYLRLDSCSQSYPK